MSTIIDTRAAMEREIGEIIKDIAAGDSQQANQPFGPYAGIFHYFRTSFLDAPYEVYLEDPMPFIQALSTATSVEAAMKVFTRMLVISYLRKQRDQQAYRGTSNAWWDRMIAAVEEPIADDLPINKGTQTDATE